MKTKADFRTLCVHAGELKDTQHGGAISPLYPSTSYSFTDVKVGQYPRYFNTPNQRGLSEKIAALEGAEAGMIFGSGMAAITTDFVMDLRVFAEDFKKEIKENTQVIYIETPSNPTLKIVDLKAVSAVAKQQGIWTMIDNTFASPVNQNPIALGIDIVIHSATKYLGGHSDICAGAVLGTKECIERVFSSAKNFGGSLSDYTVWLLERSVKTLFIRVQTQNKNAQLIAEFLDQADWVDHVFYPGLASHPDHALAKEQMHGFGGMLSFNLAGAIDSKKFLLSLELIKASMSLAGIETTALSPHLTSHALLTEEERLAQGITPQMIRFSTGIEAIEDLKADLNQAYKKAIK